MPAFAADAPRIKITVFGSDIMAPAPFAAGHALTDHEAAFFNRSVAAAVGNPFASALKKLKEAGKTAEIPTNLQSAFDEKYAGYAIGVRGSGESTSTASPLDKMIHNLATAKLEAMIVAKGRKPSEFKAKSTKTVNGVETDKTAFQRNLETLIERDKDAFTAQAQSVLASLTDDVDTELDTPVEHTSTSTSTSTDETDTASTSTEGEETTAAS